MIAVAPAFHLGKEVIDCCINGTTGALLLAFQQHRIADQPIEVWAQSRSCEGPFSLVTLPLDAYAQVSVEKRDYVPKECINQTCDHQAIGMQKAPGYTW